MTQPSGRVYLVGAGCGPADWITLRGYQLLKTCGAVVYDDLIAPELLDAVPPQAQKLYMGKRLGRHSAPQEDISQTLISLAQAGHTVVRLKGGDPFVFGRGGEEIQALQGAGVPFEVVPGISSAIAIPGQAGIPVTHRGLSRSFHVITAHTKDGASDQLDRLAGAEGTLVILMGLSQLPAIVQRLMAAGRAPDTPAALVSGGCAPHPAAAPRWNSCPRRRSGRGSSPLPSSWWGRPPPWTCPPPWPAPWRGFEWPSPARRPFRPACAAPWLIWGPAPSL